MTHADIFRRSELQLGGAVATSKTASSFTACTFENNEAVRLCFTNRRLLRRTHTSILFFSFRLLLLVVLPLLSFLVVMAMLARLTLRTATAVSASGERRNHHHSYGKRTNLRLMMMMIGSLGLRCHGCCCYGHSKVNAIVGSDVRHE